MILYLAILQISIAIITYKLKTFKLLLPVKVFEVFSAFIWIFYKDKIYFKYVDFDDINESDYIIKNEMYNLNIDNINLRLKTISYYSKKLNIRLIQLIPVDIKNKKYLIVENPSNYTN